MIGGENDMVSIIVAILNNEAYIDRCIESILAQTYQNFEVLLMVGLCQDASLEKCIYWQKKDNRIIIVSRKDTSLGDARNYALPMAKGEFIAYIDGDDSIERDYLEKLVRPLEMFRDVDFSACGYGEYCEGNLAAAHIPKQEGLQQIDFDGYLDLGIFVTVWVKMYRKKFLTDFGINMFDGLCEDEGHQFMLAAFVRKVYIVCEPLYRYNVSNPNSLITARTMEARLDYVRSMDFAIVNMKNRHVYEKNRNNLKFKVCAALQTFLATFGYRQDMVKAYRDFVRRNFPEMNDLMRYSSVKMDGRVFIMYGAGKDAERVIRALPEGTKVSYVVDGDCKKVGGTIMGIEIKSVDDLKKKPKDTPILISSRKYMFEIARGLKEKGFEEIYYPMDVLSAKK